MVVKGSKYIAQTFQKTMLPAAGGKKNLPEEKKKNAFKVNYLKYTQTALATKITNSKEMVDAGT